MPNSLLVQFSNELAALAANARDFVAGVHADGHHVSGVLWTSNAVVVSEQALPAASEYQVTIADRTVKAGLAGRDEGTNVAVLKLDGEIAAPRLVSAAPKTGALALVAGAGEHGITARLAAIRSVGGAWESLTGGTIAQRIVLDGRIGRAEEGGPVLAADGGLFGMSTRGAGRQSLVIPTATVEKAVGVLLEKGSVERGWLGLSLRPVALPETLRPEQSQRVGLMVMDVAADSPAAKAGILAGDIVLSAGGTPATRFGAITRRLGPDSIGKTIPIALARAGTIHTNEATIAPRKSG